MEQCSGVVDATAHEDEAQELPKIQQNCDVIKYNITKVAHLRFLCLFWYLSLSHVPVTRFLGFPGSLSENFACFLCS